MTDKKAVDEAKNRALIKSIERKEKLQALTDYVGFGVAKVSGLATLVTGALELFDPNILPINLSHPESALTVGVALLAGKQVLGLIAKAAKALES